MSTPKRKREVQVNFRVSPEELALIEQKMSQLGPVDKVGYFKIAAKKMTWKPRKEPLQEWDTSICLT